MRFQHKITLLAALGGTWIGTVGCGSEDPFGYVPVSGKVMYEDGTPVTTGRLQFESTAPPQGNAHPRPAVALIKPDGSFTEATSHKFGDGLIPGKHKVAFIFATDAAGKSLVPQEYTSITTSPLEIDTANAPLEITVPKP